MMQPKTMKLSEIRTGDLLVWSSFPQNRFSDFLIKAIAFLTRSKYGHVGIAWRIDDKEDNSVTHFAVEATIPRIAISKLEAKGDVYCVPAAALCLKVDSAFLIAKAGLPYSIMDAIRGYFGITTRNDDQYQCAEFAHEFYMRSGMPLPLQLTPNRLVENLKAYYRLDIYQIVP